MYKRYRALERSDLYVEEMEVNSRITGRISVLKVQSPGEK